MTRHPLAAAAARQCRDEGGRPDDYFPLYCAVRHGADPDEALRLWRETRDG